MRSLQRFCLTRLFSTRRSSRLSPPSGIVGLLWVGFFLAVFSIPVFSAGGFAEEPSAEGAAAPRTHEVRVPRETLIFEPALLHIRPGDTVKWTNESDKVHVFATIPGSGTNDKELFSPMLKPGETWSHTFEKAGDYPYFCFIHNQMLGAIVVEETPAPAEKAP